MAKINVWIKRWQKGDERAAESLYNYYRESTFRLAYGLLGNSSDAEEAAQDALTYALVNIHRYDAQRARFATWLHLITVSRCRDRQRRKWLPRISLSVWLQRGHELPDPRPGPEPRALQQERDNQVWQAVQALSRPLREAILLRYWGGHTYRELAEILDCPVPTAQSRVRRAHQRLHRALAAFTTDKLEGEVV